MSFGHYPRRDTTDLVDLLARRPELRDVGIAGYLAGAAVDGAPGMPTADRLWTSGPVAFVCRPPQGVHKRTTLEHCGVCGPGSRGIQQWTGAWYGVIWHCECGDSWADGERLERPFRRGWRKKAAAKFERLWESALFDSHYESLVRSDLKEAVA